MYRHHKPKNILLIVVLLVTFICSVYAIPFNSETNHHLLLSAKNGDVSKIVECLKKGANIDIVDNYGVALTPGFLKIMDEWY